MAHASWRWHAWKLWLASASAAATRVPTQGVPEGFPTATEAASALLDRAVALATGGWLGVEHLVAAASPHGVGGAVAALCRERVQAHLAWFRGPANEGLALTPRLAALASVLPEPFDEAALWSVVCGDPGHVLHLLAGADLSAFLPLGAPGYSTIGPVDLAPSGASGFEAEHVGGPCDGLVVRWAEGPVGRWDPQTHARGALYMGAPAWDPTASRHHIDVLGPFVIQVRGQTLLRRLGHERSVVGTVALASGDLLRLGQATWLRIL